MTAATLKTLEGQIDKLFRVCPCGNVGPFYRARDKHCIVCERAKAAERMRRRSPEQKRLARDKWGYQTPLKRRARELVHQALRSGKLVRPKRCGDCGRAGVPLEAHHENYRRPLAVDWCCALCHARRHALHAV